MFCKNCGTELQENSKFCPNCGEEVPTEEELQLNQESKGIQKVVGGCFTFIIGAVSIFFIAAIVLFTDKPQKSLKVTESHPCSLGYGANAICGTIENLSDNNISYVQVEVNLYDQSGNQIGSTLDNISNLEARGKWKFQAVIIQDNVADYKIKNINSL